MIAATAGSQAGEASTPPETEPKPALAVTNLSKTFSGTRALNAFELAIGAGEIHALIGENGSGKSTFIKILAGYHLPDSGGETYIGGHRLDLGSPDAAYALGCRFVHQDLGLVGDLSVADNLFLNSGFPTRFGTIRTRTCLARAKTELARLGLDIDPRTKVQDLSPAQRSGVAVARSLMRDPMAPVRLMVFDEPTATLPEDEVQRLLSIVRAVAASGVGVLYVTHRLDEIFGLAANVTVLRDGCKVATEPVKGLTRSDVVNLLVGGEFNEAHSEVAHLDPGGGPAVLQVTDLASAPIAGVSFGAQQREIVGIAGITGSGRETILSAIFGGAPRDGGTVHVNGKALAADRPDVAVSAGIAYLPADRKVKSGLMELNAHENLMITDVKAAWRWPKLRRKVEIAESRRWFEELEIRPMGCFDKLLETFSGGNQQKILLAKWLRIKPKLVLLDEPTQGVDVGAKAVIYSQLIQVAGDGAAVVMSSSDVDELAALCHRVIVLREGRISAELSGNDVTVRNISRAVLGREIEVGQDEIAS
jgi:ribose transport system ATP-binding protein